MVLEDKTEYVITTQNILVTELLTDFCHEIMTPDVTLKETCNSYFCVIPKDHLKQLMNDKDERLSKITSFLQEPALINISKDMPINVLSASSTKKLRLLSDITTELLTVSKVIIIIIYSSSSEDAKAMQPN